MKSSLVSLKLVLDELGVKPSIETLNDRKRVQKAVYLAQAAGLDLGYAYGWYLKGPYSRRLTRDYFALDEALTASEESEVNAVRLKPEVRELLGTIKPALEPPDGVDLDDASWLELLASLRYLRCERNLGESDSDAVIADEKKALHPFVDEGRRVLAGCGLL